jgi:hypothetical protein
MIMRLNGCTVYDRWRGGKTGAAVAPMKLRRDNMN